MFQVDISQNMKKRGIHDVFYAALLQIHKPNDDQLFPGWLDEQIVEPEISEWTAECIVAHCGVKTNAMFEVLWKAGNKSWMNYNQVKELNLLLPYLELLGYKRIEELTEEGSGQPPLDDPQVFLGHLTFMDYLGDQPEGESFQKTPLYLGQPQSNFYHPALSPTHIYLYSAMGHPNPYGNRGLSGSGPGQNWHYPFLSFDPTTCMVVLHDPAHPGCETLLHPLQIQLYLDFDLEVHQTHGDPRSPVPMGYYLFASILNSADSDTECRYQLSTYNNEWCEWTKVKYPFPLGLLPTSFTNPCLDLLVMLGFISKQGDVDKQTVEDAIRAWWAPSGQRVQQTKQYHVCQLVYSSEPRDSILSRK